MLIYGENNSNHMKRINTAEAQQLIFAHYSELQELCDNTEKTANKASNEVSANRR